MKRDCEICRGSGRVRLPIYRRATMTAFGAGPIAAAEISRDYPCPECSDTVALDQLAVLQQHAFMDARINEPGYIDAAKRQAAHGLVAGLIERGFIRFERGPDDLAQMLFPVYATIGAVSPTHVATLEQRMAEHQEELAREVMAEAARGIRVWGSAYHGDEGSIEKEQAVDAVNDALRLVLQRRAAVRTA